MPKVRELIELLGNYNPEEEVVFQYDEEEGNVISIRDEDGIKNIIGWRAFEQPLEDVEKVSEYPDDEPVAVAAEEPPMEIDYEDDGVMDDTDEDFFDDEEVFYDDEEEYEEEYEDEVEHDERFVGESIDEEDIDEEDLDGMSDEELEVLAKQ